MLLSFRNEILKQFHSIGWNISIPYKFEFYLYFSEVFLAKQAAIKLGDSSLSFTCQIRYDDDYLAWLCLVSVILTPEVSPIEEIGEVLENTAKMFGGKLDGWEANLHE